MTLNELIQQQIALMNSQNPAPATENEIQDVMRQSQAAAVAEQMEGPAKLQQMYDEYARKALAEEQAGIQQLEASIQEYAKQKPGIDYTALAAWADSLTPGSSNVLQVAQSMRPPTEDERAQRLINLQNLLQQRKGAFGSRQMQGLQNAIEQATQGERFAQQQALANQRFEQEKMRSEAYAEQMRQRNLVDLIKSQAAMEAKNATQAAADARQQAGLEQKRDLKIEDQVNKFEKRQIDAIPLVENIKNIESHLGFDLENWDPETNTIGGQKIDIPGFAIVPGIGPTFLPGSTGEDFNASFKSIFNTVLKDRSGAAVTEPELARLQGEFAQGKFNTEEKMITALQRYKRILQKQMRQREAAFMPEAVERFRERGGYTSTDLFGNTVPSPKGVAPQEEKEWGGKKWRREGDEWVEVTN